VLFALFALAGRGWLRGMPPSRTVLSSSAGPSSMEDMDAMEILSIKTEIGSMLEQILGFGRSTGNINALDPRILTENAHVITKGRLYEEVMSSRVEAAADRQEVQELERADAFLKGFITSERKSRARMKVNYILAGAGSQRLEESILMLSESDEIDEELLFYLDSLVKKEVLRAAGPSSLLEEEGQSLAESFTDVERSFMAANKDTLNILRMIQRRLKAELRMKGRAEVQLLARLMAEADPKERYSVMKNALDRVEALEDFASFLQNGIDHLNQAGFVAKPSQNEGSVELPVSTVERMRDILYDVQQLSKMLDTGLRDAAYSTQPEDYLDR